MCGTTGESPTLSNHEKLALLEATRRGGARARRARHRRDHHLQHGRKRRAVARGGALGRRRHPGHGAVLQQSAAGRAVPALPRDRRRRSICRSSSTTSRPARRATWRPARRCAWRATSRTSSASKKPARTSSRSARSFATRPPGFRVWSGNDGDILTIMALGGYGVVSVAAHLVGQQIAELMQRLPAQATTPAPPRSIIG